MLALVAALSAIVTALMLTIKARADVKFASTDPSTRAFAYQILAMIFGGVGALAVMAQTPALFTGDPLFGNTPILGFVAAGLISTLPGGVGVSLLGLLYPKPLNSLNGQAVVPERQQRGLLPWS